jgi:hypothetical protein
MGITAILAQMYGNGESTTMKVCARAGDTNVQKQV